MSEPRPRVRSRRRTIVRRRRLTAVAVLALGIVAIVAIANGTGGSAGSSGSGQGSDPAIVRLELGGRIVAQAQAKELRRATARAALLDKVPARRTVRHGGATIHFRVERSAAGAAMVRAVRGGGGTVTVDEQPVAASIRVPLVKQALRDNCETAALSMVLAFRGKPVGQLTLQRRVAHSPPLDPTVGPDGSEVWGDPNEGFVGRADGTGPAGGFGVYQGPIKALAAREGVSLRELTGSTPAAVYKALLTGHPVMIWVALSEGPFESWETLSGKKITVNWGEHAMVLTGIGPEGVRLNDPLSGTRLSWSKEQFEAMWRALGSRALAA